MAMNVGNARDGDPLSEINTTPLIDVMLVLLIMLIVTLPPPRHAVKLNTPVPCKTCEPQEEEPRAVLIVVDFDGSLSWNEERIRVAELDGRLASEAHRQRQPEIHIKPHRMARYEDVIHVMASAQRQGLQRVGVIGGT
ncbi:MAG TPA: biopolymer transporter ExbD [Hyphomonadaceae bacterium]|nr:biopolymer transporter ExbD [Hyphomonadaceae bacterium]